MHRVDQVFGRSENRRRALWPQAFVQVPILRCIARSVDLTKARMSNLQVTALTGPVV
jgi:hypothetical protein